MLERILAGKREEVEAASAFLPLSRLLARLAEMPPARPFAAAVRRAGGHVRLIAEVKRRSPSRGWLNRELDAGAQASAYQRAGASALSVLTDREHFGGSPADLAAARSAVSLPVLRKDFIVDPYQVYESRTLGADAVLLIVAALGGRMGEFLSLVHQVGMEALVEVHDERELELAAAAGARVIGINNRDLRTMQTDLAVTRRLFPLFPPGPAAVCESGIRGAGDVREMAELGVDALLVGEALVSGPDPEARARELLDGQGPDAAGREAWCR